MSVRKIVILLMLGSVLVWGNEIISAQDDPTGLTLSSFDRDTEGWQLSPGGAGRELALSTSGPDCQSAELQVNFTGTGTWEEAGVRFAIPPALNNLSMFTTYSMDIYIDSDVTRSDFLIQFYTKTGDKLEWKQSPNQAVSPGQWVNLSAELSNLGNLSDTHEAGFKIGSTITPFAGSIFFDNVTFSAIPNDIIPPVVYEFKENLQEWELDSSWTGGTALNHSTQTGSGPSCGALKLTGEFDGSDAGKATLIFKELGTEVQNFSPFQSLGMDVYSPPEAQNFAAQVLIQSGIDGAWQGMIETQLVPGIWTPLQLNLVGLQGIEQIRAIGLKVTGTLSTPLTVEFLVDNVRLSNTQGPTPTPIMPTATATETSTIAASAITLAPDSETPTATPSPASSETPTVTPSPTVTATSSLEGVHSLYTFDTDILPWALTEPLDENKGKTISYGTTPDGQTCLLLEMNYPGGIHTDAFVSAELPPEQIEWSGFADWKLAMDIYVPSGLETGGAKLFIKYGPDSLWVESDFIKLGNSGWITISAPLLSFMTPPPSPVLIVPDALADVRAVGVKIGTSSPFNGIACVDNVRLVKGTPVQLEKPCMFGQSVLIIPSSHTLIRSGPSTDYGQVGYLLPNRLVPVYARNAAGDWLRLSPDNEWWVSRGVVTVQGDADALPVQTVDTGMTGTTWLDALIGSGSLPWQPALPDQWIAGKSISYGAGPDGQSALLLQTGYSGTAYQDAGIAAQLSESSKDWSLCTWLAADVYIPPAVNQGGVKLHITYGENFQWVESEYIELSGATGWIPIMVTLKDMKAYPPDPTIVPDLTSVQEVGLRVGSSTFFEGIIAIDNIRLLR